MWLCSHGPSGFPHPQGLPLSLLQHLLSTLLLRGKAGNGPDFDLNAVVELLPSHVPHALVGSCNGPVLQGKQRVRAQPQPAWPHSPRAPAWAGAVPPVLVLELELTPWQWAIHSLSSSAVTESSPELPYAEHPSPLHLITNHSWLQLPEPVILQKTQSQGTLIKHSSSKNFCSEAVFPGVDSISLHSAAQPRQPHLPGLHTVGWELAGPALSPLSYHPSP